MFSVSEDFITWTPPAISMKPQEGQLGNTLYNHMGFVYGDHYPSKTEIQEHLVLPLIEQLTIDAGADVVHLTRGRLGIEGEYISVRQQSRDMRVTRARVYQLLEECDRIMDIRWPEGRRFFQVLGERFKLDRRESMASELFMQTYDLFFPKKYERVEAVLSEVE